MLPGHVDVGKVSRFGHFSFCMRSKEQAVFELPAKISSTSLDSATLISCKIRKFWRFESICNHFGYFFRCTCLATCLETALFLISKSVSVNIPKFWRFDNALVDFGHIFTAHAQKRRLRNSCHNSDNVIEISDPVSCNSRKLWRLKSIYNHFCYFFVAYA